MVLRLRVLPCTHRNIEGILLYLKIVLHIFGKNRKSVTKAQQHQNIIRCTVHPGMPLGILMPIVFLHAAYKSCRTRRHVGESMCAKFEAGRYRSPFWRLFWPILWPGRAAGTKAQPRPDQPSSTAQDQAPRQRSVPPATRAHTHTGESIGTKF